MDKNILENNKWKNKNPQYLFELQKFLDLADNIENKKLKELVINQMLKCDKCLTNIANEMLKTIINENNNKEEKKDGDIYRNRFRNS